MNDKLINEVFQMAREALNKHTEQIIDVWMSDDAEAKKMTVSLTLGFSEQSGGLKCEAGISFSKGKVSEKSQKFFDEKQIKLWE